MEEINNDEQTTSEAPDQEPAEQSEAPEIADVDTEEPVTSTTSEPEKKKTGMIIGVVAVVIILIVLAILIF